MLGVRIPFSLFTGPLPPALACPAPAGQAPLPQGGAAAPRPEGRGAFPLTERRETVTIYPYSGPRAG